MTGAQTSGLIRVMCGVHSLEVGLAGRSIAEIRRALAQPLNIDPRAVAIVNGAQAAEAYETKAGDQVEFVRLAGEKGSTPLRALGGPWLASQVALSCTCGAQRMHPAH